MTSKPNARVRAVQTATSLFQRQGYHGTGLTQIIEESASPKGSFYHHFPDGKEQLALEAILSMRDQLVGLIAVAAEGAANEAQYIKRCVRALERWLEASDFLEGCPVAGFAVEGAQNPELRKACHETYELWCKTLAKVLRSFGYSTSASRDRAILILTALDGAGLMSRVSLDAKPLHRAGRALIAGAVV
jgi:TetR/AcrR family transcriptional repressor of lmrAB and yxaGH operons